MNIKKAYIVHNSGAGKNKGAIVASKIADELKLESEAQVEIFESNNKDADDRFVKNITCFENSLVIVLGGDGTLGAIVRSLIENNVSVPVAVYPCGTANDFATAQNIPKKIPQFVDFLLSTEPVFIDVAKVCESSYAINAVGSGNFSNGVTTYSHRAKKFFGKFGYYFKCIGEFFKKKACELTFDCDGEIVKTQTLMYYLVNSSRAGGFNHFAPMAEINDGKFDLVIVKKCGFFSCLKVFADVLAGKHKKNKNVIVKTISNLTVSGGEGHPKFYRADIDGNAGPIGTLKVEIVKDKVKIFINSKQ